MDAGYDAWLSGLKTDLASGQIEEAGARSLVERLALALQAGVLLRAGSPVADAFCRSRLDGVHGLAFGSLAGGWVFVACPGGPCRGRGGTPPARAPSPPTTRPAPPGDTERPPPNHSAPI